MVWAVIANSNGHVNTMSEEKLVRGDGGAMSSYLKALLQTGAYSAYIMLLLGINCYI